MDAPERQPTTLTPLEAHHLALEAGKLFIAFLEIDSLPSDFEMWQVGRILSTLRTAPRSFSEWEDGQYAKWEKGHSRAGDQEEEFLGIDRPSRTGSGDAFVKRLITLRVFIGVLELGRVFYGSELSDGSFCDRIPSPLSPAANSFLPVATGPHWLRSTCRASAHELLWGLPIGALNDPMALFESYRRIPTPDYSTMLHRSKLVLGHMRMAACDLEANRVKTLMEHSRIEYAKAWPEFQSLPNASASTQMPAYLLSPAWSTLPL